MEQFEGKTYRQFIWIYRFTLFILIILGSYYNFSGKTTGGVLYGRYGGSTTVAYGGNGFLIMAAASLAFQLLISIISKSKK